MTKSFFFKKSKFCFVKGFPITLERVIFIEHRDRSFVIKHFYIFCVFVYAYICICMSVREYISECTCFCLCILSLCYISSSIFLRIILKDRISHWTQSEFIDWLNFLFPGSSYFFFLGLGLEVYGTAPNFLQGCRRVKPTFSCLHSKCFTYWAISLSTRSVLEKNSTNFM